MLLAREKLTQFFLQMEKRKIPNLSRQPTDSSTKGVELKINVSFKNWWLEKFEEIPQILKIPELLYMIQNCKISSNFQVETVELGSEVMRYLTYRCVTHQLRRGRR